MSTNINTIQKTSRNLVSLAEQVGMLLMATATVTGMMELPNHPNNRVILPGQPSFAMATENEEQNNPIRREREETEQHYISYSVSQRTPGRASKN